LVNLVPCLDLDEYAEVWSKSEQSSPFNALWFISCVTKDPKILLCKEGSETLAAVYFENNHGLLVSPKFSVYHSILISHPNSRSKTTNNIIFNQRLISDILSELKSQFGHFELSLHPSLQDVRSFSWSNFQDRGTKKIEIEPRYTAIKSLEINSNRELDYSSWSSGRKYDLLKSIKGGIQILDFYDLGQFMQLYKETFHRQNIEINPAIEVIIEKIFHSIPIDCRVAKIAVDKNGKYLSAGITIIHKEIAYGLFLANRSESRNTGSSTLLTYNLMTESYERGAREYDFVGANSPNRGDFKLSFNSRLQTYFETKYS